MQIEVNETAPETAETPPLFVSQDAWRDFLTPQSNEAYLAGWLAIVCRKLEGTRAAVLFLRGDTGQLGLAAGWSTEGQDLADYAPVADQTTRRAEPFLKIDPGGPLLGYPIQQDGAIVAVTVMRLTSHPGAGLQGIMREMHWASGWLESRLWQGRAALGTQQAQSARLVLDLLAATDVHQRFEAAALALVNELPQRSGFDRAALAMMRGKRLRLEALSRDTSFSRKAALVRQYEAAMAEAADQSDVVVYPERPDGRNMIRLSHQALSRDTGAGLIMSTPLLVRGEVVGVLLVEKNRAQDEVLELDDSAVLDFKLAATAIAPLLKAKYDETRWISGKGRYLAGRGLSALFGRRPAFTVGAIVLAALVATPFFVPVDQRVRADATLRGGVQRSIVAPVDGFIEAALVQAGDVVAAGDVLVRLDDRDLRLEQSAALAAVRTAEQNWRQAIAEVNRTNAALARAELDEARARLALIDTRLERLTIRAAQPGQVISGDLSQRIGAPVRLGDVLFEVATLDRFRLFVDVSEFDLELVAPGQSGGVVFSGQASRTVPFTVTSIASVSTPENGENRFRVDASVDAGGAALRPGLQGVAKITTGQTTLARQWLRGTLVRARLLLWRVLP
ncbi:MAG: efflux RND transporter periplasmic adaptor subunit [Paracoccaceae bacterium]